MKSKFQEKIKSRAERFGGFQSDDAKKAARAAKFGDMLGKQVTIFLGEGFENQMLLKTHHGASS